MSGEAKARKEDDKSLAARKLSDEERDGLLRACWPGKGLPPANVTRYARYDEKTALILEWGWIKGGNSVPRPDELWAPPGGWPTSAADSGSVKVISHPLNKLIPDHVEQAIRASQDDSIGADPRKLVMDAKRASSRLADSLDEVVRAAKEYRQATGPLLGLRSSRVAALEVLAPMLLGPAPQVFVPRHLDRLLRDMIPELDALTGLAKRLPPLQRVSVMLQSTPFKGTWTLRKLEPAEAETYQKPSREVLSAPEYAKRLRAWASSVTMKPQGRPKDRTRAFLMHTACWLYDSAAGWWIADYSDQPYEPPRRSFVHKVLSLAQINLSAKDYNTLDRLLPPIPDQIKVYLKTKRRGHTDQP